MTTRRAFIKTLAALSPVLTFGRSWAAADPTRLALVIGNSSYRDSPLVNPVNDAKAVTGLFTEAGFTVDSRVNTTRAEMMGAIERFGAAVKRSETRLVVFYYAGHGAQLDWRNYLLPVDAVVERQEDMKQRCVDLNQLLAQLGAAKDKTFIVILDACRNNPFGRSYQPEQKGLSQFDAPVGSLLAYATAPGNVASDGEGANGLYTENLVRELSKRNTRIEDALKRVRLNVRLASRGAQIPWETTSLETDVFIFNEGQKKLTEAEEEKLLEADIADWGRIKSSTKIDDWVSYLRTFPNGRFAEIAQMRLNRLLADVEKQRVAREREEAAKTEKLAAEKLAAEKLQQEEQKRMEQQKLAQAAAVKPAAVQTPAAAPAASPAPVPATTQAPQPAAAAPSDAPMIDIRAGVAVPMLFASSVNPFSAGRYPLGRVYTVGDRATYRRTDILTGVEQRLFTWRVTRVDFDADRVEFNNGLVITDLMSNTIKQDQVEFPAPRQWTPAEFHVGKKWAATFLRIDKRKRSTVTVKYDMRIVERETISVPAGRFDTFRIEGKGWTSDNNQLDLKLWLVPGLNFDIKREYMYGTRGESYYRTERNELVSLLQHTIDTECATPGKGPTRNLMIKSNCP
jgi:uncharacterized caspase-like protein